MASLRLVAAFVGVLFVAWSDHAANERSPEEDVAVLSAVVASHCSSHPAGRYEVLSAQTFVAGLVPTWGNLDQDVLESLLRRNRSVQNLPTLALCPTFRSVPRVHIEGQFVKEGWRGFYETFPQAIGFAEMSIPGYSADGKEAIVELRTSCDRLCGRQIFWVVHKVDGKWKTFRFVNGSVA